MQTLFDLMEIDFSTRFSRYNCSLVEVLSTDQSSAAFIRRVLKDPVIAENGHKWSKRKYIFAQSRAKHSINTFLMGLVFSEFAGMEDLINEQMKETGFDVLWMLTALYHDYGYYSDLITDGNLDYRKKVKHYLLADEIIDSRLELLEDYETKHMESLAYTYMEIEGYDKYARKYHNKKTKDYEKIDHGILGGVLIFDRLIKKALVLGEDKDYLSAKTSCITIAQHNIHKSDSAKTDSEYGNLLNKLHHDSNFKIGLRTPLLLLLCLVDTIECIKRFGREEVKSSYFQSKTVLSNISIDVSRNRIVIDYRMFSKEIEKKEDKRGKDSLKKNFMDYKKHILEFNSWTDFRANEEMNNVIVIELDERT